MAAAAVNMGPTVVSVVHALYIVDAAAFLVTFSMALSTPKALLMMADTVTGIMLKQAFLGQRAIQVYNVLA